MNSRWHSLFPMAVLTLLAGVSVWLDRVTQQEPVVKTDKTRHAPDFSAEKLTLRRFDLSGKTQYVLLADSMVHYPDDESTELTRPRLTYLNRPEPVFLEADSAHISKDGETVLLSRNVLVRRSATAGKPESNLRTEKMTVWPDDERMRTEAPVELTQGATRITADNLQSDHIAGELRLQGQVRGTLYRTTPTPKP